MKQQSLQPPRAQLSCKTSPQVLARLTCGVLHWPGPSARTGCRQRLTIAPPGCGVYFCIISSPTLHAHCPGTLHPGQLPQPRVFLAALVVCEAVARNNPNFLQVL